MVLAVASRSCLLLLWGSSSYSLSRLVSCFRFLRRLFRLFSWFQGFLSYFSDLVFCSSQSCLGLQWFWSSCPFRCWGSRLPLPIAVFRISLRGLVPFCSRILYLDGSSSVFLGGIQPSPPVSRLSLGWLTRAISILRLSLSLLYSWRLCSSCFPPSRLWSSRMAFHSVTVPLVYSLLLLESSYSPQLFCGSS